MGEDLDAEGRMAVRTPMQWTSGRNGGFSTAAPSRLASAVVTDGYGPQHVNVSDQRRDPGSLWTFVQLLARRYRECPELGWGTFAVLDQPHTPVLAHRCTWEDASIVVLHNLGPDPVDVPLRLDDADQECALVDLLEPGTTPLDGQGRAELALGGYGYRWLRLQHPGERRLP